MAWVVQGQRSLLLQLDLGHGGRGQTLGCCFEKGGGGFMFGGRKKLLYRELGRSEGGETYESCANRFGCGAGVAHGRRVRIARELEPRPGCHSFVPLLMATSTPSLWQCEFMILTVLYYDSTCRHKPRGTRRFASDVLCHVYILDLGLVSHNSSTHIS